MAFTPAVLTPEPEPWFVRELHLIDPSLRVVWGYSRYLMNRWVIERRMSPERYAAAYASVIRSGSPRFIEQPIFDHDHPIYDPSGIQMGVTIIGYRKYDLAPEWEWIMTISTKDKQFKQLGMDDILDLKRQYAWNYTHPLSRARFEEEERKKEEAKEREHKRNIQDMVLDACDQAWSEHGVRLVGGQAKTIMAGTEL